MKKYFSAFFVILFILGLIALWIVYLEFMLFPPKPTLPAEKKVTVEEKEPAPAPAPAEKFRNNKKQAISRLASPVRKKMEKPVKQVVSGYPWHKLLDSDVALALVFVGFFSFAGGVSYFQLGWKKNILQ